MHGEIDYSKDPQSESPHGYDVFGNELYEGSTIWRGDEGVMLDPDTDNYDPNNPIMTLLVQQIAEHLGISPMKLIPKKEE